MAFIHVVRIDTIINNLVLVSLKRLLFMPGCGYEILDRSIDSRICGAPKLNSGAHFDNNLHKIYAKTRISLHRLSENILGRGCLTIIWSDDQ